MSDVKISALPSAGSLTGSEVIPMVQGGVTKQVALSAVTGLVDLSGYLQKSGGTMTGPITLSATSILSGNTNAIQNSTNANNYLQVASGGVVLNSNGEVTVQATALNVTTGSYKGQLKTDNLTSNRVIQFQDKAYTGVADLSDLGGASSTEIGYLSGATSNIQNQINNINSGLSWKVAARILCSTNINISSPGATLDGVTMASGDRVVLNGQTTGSQNGVYVWNGSAVAMTRATDCSTGGTGSTGVLGMTITIEEGTSADQIWILTTNAPITIGTTTLTFAKSSNTTYTGSNGIALTGNNFTFDNTYFSGDATISSLGIISIGSGKVTNSMLAGSIDLTSKVTGLLPDANISSASTWNAKQNALGFIPENVANKATDFTTINNTLYPTTQAVDDAYSPAIGLFMAQNFI